MKTDAERMLLAFLALTELREKEFWKDCNGKPLGLIDAARMQAVKRLASYEEEDQRRERDFEEARLREAYRQ